MREVGQQLSQEYHGKDLVLVMVLKGAVPLVADLMRELALPFSLEVIQCSSYGQRGKERGELQIFGLERLHVHNRDVLVVDDIFDSGTTMSALYCALSTQKPRSLKSCVLLKKKVEHATQMRPDYILFEIENLFVVGYGLDYKEQYRGLPNISIVETT